QDAMAARGDGKVQRVDLSVVSEQLRQPPEVEQVWVWEARQRLHDGREVLVSSVDEVVLDESGPVSRYADQHLLEQRLDQPALGAELDDVALDFDPHSRDHLGALEHGESVVEGHSSLELEG